MVQITAALCRAARALLDMHQDKLAKSARVSINTVRNFESGKSVPMLHNLAAIQAALEAEGVEFIPANGGGAGLRMKAKAG